MNNNIIGFQRDREILALVEALGAMKSEQVGICLFQQRFWRRKAQERLQRLFTSGRLKRTNTGNGFAYFVAKQGLLEHTIDLAWAYTWLRQGLMSWETLEFEREKDYGILRCDGFATILNRPMNTTKHYFIEIDRSYNLFDKVPKYCQFYTSYKYETEDWVKTAKRFPTILTITSSNARMRHIRKAIAKDNTANLTFEVKLLEDIRGECLGKHLRRTGPASSVCGSRRVDVHLPSESPGEKTVSGTFESSHGSSGGHRRDTFGV